MSRWVAKLLRGLSRLWPLTLMMLCIGLAGLPASNEALVRYREYQLEVARDHHSKSAIIHWSRQIGKSFVLAGWAVERLLLYPGRLVTVLSNSKDNGAEFALKAQEVCRLLGKAAELEDLSPDDLYENTHFEVRVKVMGKVGRIKVLAANPRTARGFSGDLILDEFAFHEDSQAIWEAAEPIISSNPDYFCRISSTGNGKRNMFYQLISDGRIKYYRMPRSQAWALGLRVYSAIDGRQITPDQAREEASDKRAYDQNYECMFADENMALLTHALISAAEREGIDLDEGEWRDDTLERIAAFEGDVYVGQDVGRTRDISVQWALGRQGYTWETLGVLRMDGKRLPDQCDQLRRVCELPNFRRACLDMTGIGLGLVEFAQSSSWGGLSRIIGVNFATTEPITKRIAADGRKRETALVTEIMATDLLGEFESAAITIPASQVIRADLRKPEKVVSPSGRVSIAASRDKDGHADFFWALALARRAGTVLSGSAGSEAVGRDRLPERVGLAESRSRREVLI